MFGVSCDADRIVRAIAAGPIDGISHTQFPQPGQLKGILGVRLENGRTFASHAELQRYWTTGDVANDLSESDSQLDDDEGNLQQLQVSCAILDLGQCSLIFSAILHVLVQSTVPAKEVHLFSSARGMSPLVGVLSIVEGMFPEYLIASWGS